MLSIRKRRIYFILTIVIGMSIAVSLSLFALRNNINLYLTPQQVKQRHIRPNQQFRLGGLVMQGSVHHYLKNNTISFILTDFHRKMKVEYHGILPSLFHEGQGIVADGHLSQSGIFIADQVLAKHDSTYRPPAVS